MAVICFELENFNVSNTFIKAFDNAIRGFLANSAELSPVYLLYLNNNKRK